MSDPFLLTLNAGSSSIKIGLFGITHDGPKRVGQGTIDLGSSPIMLHFSHADGVSDIALKSALSVTLYEVMGETLDWFADNFALKKLSTVGHRVVHGGDHFDGPATITEDSLAAIAALLPMAPFHQAQSLRLIHAIRHVRPDLSQTASFDTAFHRTQTDLVRRFALPREYFDAGVKHYGFHGLSYQYIAGALAQRYARLAHGRVVAAHLGSGASLCGLSGGLSRDTSTGFSTLDGIPMATRCGTLDAGVVLYMLQQQRRSTEEVEDILYKKSGLLGISGISGDSRVLLASRLPEACEALNLFAFRIAGEAARLANTLGGLESLVFTGGIGEHQPEVRAAVCARLAWLGIDFDCEANNHDAGLISRAGSRVTVLVVPTDEEQIIANEAASVFHQQELAT